MDRYIVSDKAGISRACDHTFRAPASGTSEAVTLPVFIDKYQELDVGLARPSRVLKWPRAAPSQIGELRSQPAVDGPTVIEITAVGEKSILAKIFSRNGEPWRWVDEGTWSLIAGIGKPA